MFRKKETTEVQEEDALSMSYEQFEDTELSAEPLSSEEIEVPTEDTGKKSSLFRRKKKEESPTIDTADTFEADTFNEDTAEQEIFDAPIYQEEVEETVPPKKKTGLLSSRKSRRKDAEEEPEIQNTSSTDTIEEKPEKKTRLSLGKKKSAEPLTDEQKVDDIKPVIFKQKGERETLPEYDFERDGPLVDPQYNPAFKLIESYWIQPGLVKVVVVNSPANEYQYLVFEPEMTPFEKDMLERLYEGARELVILKDVSTKGDMVALLYEAIDQVLERHQLDLSSETIYKFRYYLKRNMFGWGVIDALREDPNIEDISCDGAGIPIFLYHRKFRTIRTSIIFEDQRELDSLVVLFAQRSGKHISYATPIVDTSLSDGSRAQLTYGEVTTSNGSSFTIRKFREVPFSPINLIMNETFSVDEMAYLWMAVEFNQSIIFIGGTASGKTTSLNAVAQFIPQLTKIVSIEDTREITLSHDNWVASVVPETSNVAENRHEITMFDLLKTAMRQRPDYIIVGEVRGVEAQTLFQAMNTGHTTFSTLHAGNVDAAIHRLENEPLNVPKATIEALNVVVSQVRMYRDGKQIRRCNEIVEIVGMSETKNITVNTVFKYHPETDEAAYSGRAEVYGKIAERTGTNVRKIIAEKEVRERILNAMVEQNIYDYRDVSHILWIYSVLPEKVIDSLEDLHVLLQEKKDSVSWEIREQIEDTVY